MSDFGADVKAWTEKTKARQQEIYEGVCDEVLDSIVNGSAITGAPGQPVAAEDGGQLKASWEKVVVSPTVTDIVTDSPYAVPNEDGVTRTGHPYTQRSGVGGRHSVRLTRAGFSRIVDKVTQDVVGANP